MESALVHVIARRHWQWFGTLTFRQASLPDKYRLRMWFQFARTVSRWDKVRWSDFQWVLRQEAGEIGGRLHYHFLMRGCPPSSVCMKRAMMMKRMWEGTCKGGFSRIRVFDPALGGADYVMKCLDIGANSYELVKFSGCGSEVMIADSFWSGSQTA